MRMKCSCHEVVKTRKEFRLRNSRLRRSHRDIHLVRRSAHPPEGCTSIGKFGEVSYRSTKAPPKTAGPSDSLSSVLTVLYSNKPPCLIFHRTALASIDVATGYASFSRLADEKLSCGVSLDIIRSAH